MSIPECSPDLLRTLFLFEKLTDDQLESLCQAGHITEIDRGQVYLEGEPATCFYVLIEGEVVLSKLSWRRRHRDQQDHPARRLLGRLDGVSRRSCTAGLRGVDASDDSFDVFRPGRRQVRQRDARVVSNGGSSTRRCFLRQEEHSADHRSARRDSLHSDHCRPG